MLINVCKPDGSAIANADGRGANEWEGDARAGFWRSTREARPTHSLAAGEPGRIRRGSQATAPSSRYLLEPPTPISSSLIAYRFPCSSLC